MSTLKAVLWFIFVQLVSLVAAALGTVVLIPFCLVRAWKRDAYSIKGPAHTRVIDRWSWEPLNSIFGNPEDGVSGQCALIGPAGSDPYRPNAWAPWRAYLWSGWRNSADSLKYVFAWEEGPLWRFGKHKAGWQRENGIKVPVIS